MEPVNLIIGSAGHIDHGKTSLIRALTGVDCDRLEEEKRRGITIDIGFARMDLGGGKSAGVVDVPGHRKFVHNMLAGAWGVDLALLVVAANDSIMPQTREHMAILEALGITRGVVAVTKMDMVDRETLEMALAEVEEFLAKSTLAGAKIIPCSSVTGQGVEEVRAGLARLADSAPARRPGAYFRMPVDRAFNVKGHGLVATGTVISGMVKTDDRMILSPGGTEVRIRRVQSHGETVDHASAGTRAALNIAGAHKDQVQRGMILGGPELFEPALWFTARLSCHTFAPRAIQHGKSYLLHIHAAEALCRVILAGKKSLAPGESSVARIILPHPIQALHGDRFVIRSSSAEETLGGGMALEPGGKPLGSRGLMAAMDKWKALETAESGVAAMASAQPYGFPMQKLCAMFNITDITVMEMVSAKGFALCQIKGEKYVYLAAEGDRMIKALAGAAEKFHKKNPALPGVEEKTLAAMALPGMEDILAAHWIAEAVAKGKLARAGAALKLPGREQVFEGKEKQWRDMIAGAYKTAGLHNPPKTDHLGGHLGMEQAAANRIVRLLIQSGELVALAPDHVLHKDALETARMALVEEAQKSGPVETARYRDVIGVGRKAAIDILEHFDRTGLTRRVGNKRELA